MAFSWDGRYVLRRVNETDPLHHRIYKHSTNAADITPADNYFSIQPATASQQKFDAQRVDPGAAWPVTLEDNPTVDMCVFVLRSRP